MAGFIKVNVSDVNGNRDVELLGVASIVRVKTHKNQTIIIQRDSEYDVWSLDSKEEIEDMMREVGAKVAER